MPIRSIKLDLRDGWRVRPWACTALALAVTCVGANCQQASAEFSAPQVWQPGVISGPLHDSAPAFTPDGKTVYFGRSVGEGLPLPAIYVAHLRDGRWTTPELAAFSSPHGDMEPAIAPDGSHLVFVSSRPAMAGGKPVDGFFNGRLWPSAGGVLWRVDRTQDGWSAPRRLPDAVNVGTATFAPAIAADGSLYFMRPSEGTGRFRLYRSQFTNGDYQTPEPLSFSDGRSTDVDPAVMPDESFIVFGSGGVRSPAARGMDLFIAFRRPDGSWGLAIHLGNTVNSEGSDAEARLSPDHHTLYFSSERVAADTPPDPGGWNNGKYNIWSVPLTSQVLDRLQAESLMQAR